MKILKRVTLALCAIFVGSMAFSQVVPQQQNEVKTDFSEEQLELFVDASKQVNEVQMKTETKMIKVIEGESLDVNRFNDIAQAQQDPNADQSNFTEEEMAAFQKAVAQIVEMQGQMQAEMEKAIQETGMEVTDYQEIMLAYQQDQSLQNKINNLMEE